MNSRKFSKHWRDDNVEEVKNALAGGFKNNATIAEGFSHACVNGQLELVKVFMNHGIDFMDIEDLKELVEEVLTGCKLISIIGILSKHIRSKKFDNLMT